MKRKTTTTLWGIFLIALGIAITGNLVGFWSLDLFRGWWTLLIIVPSVISMIERGFHTINIFGFIIGVLLLLSARDYIRIESWGKLLFPIILILLGVAIITKNNRDCADRRGPNDPDQTNHPTE